MTMDEQRYTQSLRALVYTAEAALSRAFDEGRRLSCIQAGLASFRGALRDQLNLEREDLAARLKEAGRAGEANLATALFTALQSVENEIARMR